MTSSVLSWQVPPSREMTAAASTVKLQAVHQGWTDVAMRKPCSPALLRKLAPYLRNVDVERADRFCARSEDFYVVSPPLRFTNCTHWFRVHAADCVMRVTHAYVTEVGYSPPLLFPVIGDSLEASVYADKNWPLLSSKDMQADDVACVNGYLLTPSDVGPFALQTAYAGLSSARPIDLLASDAEPLCELVDDSLLHIACWAPLVGEFNLVVPPALKLLHCGLCGGGLAFNNCVGCGYGYGDLRGLVNMMTGDVMCSVPRRCVDLLVESSYHRFVHSPLDARKREHARWAASVAPCPEVPAMRGRTKRRIQL